MLRILSNRWLQRVLIAALFILIIGGGYFFFQSRQVRARVSRIGPYMRDPAGFVDWQLIGGQRCGDGPMLIPSTGFVGVAWNDGVAPLYQHTGYDIFGPDGADNVTPIYAAYDGYLSRAENWRSAVIIRHPEFDALADIVGGEQIWTYYTHMASRDGEESFISAEFPRGTSELFVAAGTLLGYQGSWSGDPARNMSRHLHFSIVRSDSAGTYLNETDIANTLDPLPFLGLTTNDDNVVICPSY